MSGFITWSSSSFNQRPNNMQLLAHRGLWNRPEEKNSLQALTASFNLGIGVETDIRDCDGSLVISHDPPRSAELLPLNVFCKPI